MRRPHLFWLIGLAGLAGLVAWVSLRSPEGSPVPAPPAVDPDQHGAISSSTPVSAGGEPGPSSVRVNVRGSGSAVADASVRILEPDSNGELGVCVTDEAGSCEVARLRPGRVRAYVHTGRYRPKTTEPVDVEPGRVTSLDVSLDEGRFISGRVYGPGGKPLVGARVGSSDVGSLLAVTDAEGRFEIGGLGDAPVNLFATADGFAPKQIRGVRAGSAGFDISLERPAILVGEVGGATEATLTVGVCHFDEHFSKEICIARQTLEPPRSTYRFEGLPSGSYDLVVDAGGFETERVAVRLEPDKTTTAPVVTLRAVVTR